MLDEIAALNTQSSAIPSVRGRNDWNGDQSTSPGSPVPGGSNPGDCSGGSSRRNVLELAQRTCGNQSVAPGAIDSDSIDTDQIDTNQVDTD